MAVRKKVAFGIALEDNSFEKVGPLDVRFEKALLGWAIAGTVPFGRLHSGLQVVVTVSSREEIVRVAEELFGMDRDDICWDQVHRTILGKAP